MASEILSNLQLGSLIINASRINNFSATSGALISAPTVTVTDSSTAASGTLTQFNAHYLAAPTLAATNSGVTTTTANTLTIGGAPQAGTNETITNTFALNVLSGAVNFVGPVGIGGILTTSTITPTNTTSGIKMGNCSVGTVNGNINYTGQFTTQLASAVQSNMTFTPTQIINGIFLRSSGTNGSYTDTFPTAAQLWSACNQIAGATFTFTMYTSYSNYIQCGTGGNLNGGVLGNSSSGFASYSGASGAQNGSIITGSTPAGGSWNGGSAFLLPNDCTYTFTFILLSSSSYYCLVK